MTEKIDKDIENLSKPEIDEFYEMKAMLKFAKKDIPKKILETKTHKKILELKAEIVLASSILTLFIFIFQNIAYFDYVLVFEGYEVSGEHITTGIDIILLLSGFIIELPVYQLDILILVPFYLIGLIFLLLGLTTTIKAIIAKKLLNDNIDTKLKYFITGSLFIILNFILFYFNPRRLFFIDTLIHSVYFYLGFYIIFCLTAFILSISITGLLMDKNL